MPVPRPRKPVAHELVTDGRRRSHRYAEPATIPIDISLDGHEPERSSAEQFAQTPRRPFAEDRLVDATGD